jgi:hypothetical protein
MRKHEKRCEIMRHAACAVAAAGCIAVVSGCERASPTDPQPPSGGQRYVLDYNVFTSQIDPILTARGCDNSSCHGGGIRGTFELSPSNDNDPQFDFSQASLQVAPTNPPQSPLVMKPLAEECGGPGHAGGAAFTSLDDPDYLAILAWIEAGEYQ